MDLPSEVFWIILLLVVMSIIIGVTMFSSDSSIRAALYSMGFFR